MPSAALAAVSARWVAAFRRLSVFSSLVSVLIGTMVLVGWWSGITLLARLSPQLAPMRPNSAIAFVLSGLALLLLSRPKSLAARLGQLCALLVLVIGLATTVEHILNVELGIENLLAVAWPNPGPLPPRMAPSTAICFTAVGLALVLTGTALSSRLYPAHWLALGTLIVSALALLGYLYGIPWLYDIASQNGMPLITVLGFLSLSLGILFARPDKGFMALFCSDGAGGILARRLLPAGILIPFLLDWLGFRGVEAGLYDATFESVIHVLLVSILLGLLVLVTSGELEQIDLRRKQTEEERSMALEKLEVTNKELEAFSYSVSHDLRTPLAATKNFVKLVLDENPSELSPYANRLLDLAYRNAVEMDALIQGLLTFSRETRRPVNKQVVDPGRVAEDVFAEMEKERTGRQIEFQVDPMPSCSADPILLKQVYRNLIANALKFTRSRPTAQIQVGAQQRDHEVVYFVRDNGVGFDMAQADQLFGVFQRLHSDEEYEGTGVGLAIVQRIVHRHGGHVWAEGEPDKGAAFFFTLGDKEPPAVVSEAKEETSSVHRAGNAGKAGNRFIL